MESPHENGRMDIRETVCVGRILSYIRPNLCYKRLDIDYHTWDKNGNEVVQFGVMENY